MNKRLRILIPAIQVLAFIALRILMRVSTTNYALNFNYFIPAKNLVTQLNYPLMAFWFSIVYVSERLPLPNPSAGSMFTMLALAVGIVFLMSVALFWYLVVREIELRRQGNSLLRFSGCVRPLISVIVLFCLGLGAVISAYLDARRQIPFMLRNGSAIGLFLTILPEVFLLVWAIALLGMSVGDFRKFMRTRAHGPAPSELEKH